MKKVLFFILVNIFFTKIFSQDINFSWARQLDGKAGSAINESYFIGTDGAKNVYVAGNFKNTIDLDPGTGVFNVTSASDNIFLCKLDALGNFVWGKQLGNGQTTLTCKSLSVDLLGNVYTTGSFTGKTDFDPGAAEHNLTAGGNENEDFFISKLNADGNFEWARQIGNAGEDGGTSVNVDNLGNVYAAGFVSGLADLDPGDGTFIRGRTGAVTAFILKLDIAGNFTYANAFETDHNSVIEFIRTDNKGNVYATGHFNGTIDFDPGIAAVSFTTTYNSQNKFLTRFDSSGNFVWVKQGIMGYDLAVDNNGNIYTYEAQLTKYDSNGNPVWAKLVGGTPYSSYQHSDIRLDDAGNIYITGLFRYTQDFDPGTAVLNITVSGGGFESDVFVCRLNPDGEVTWVKTFGNTGEDYATSLALDNAGNVYTTGLFSGTVDFDPGVKTYNLTAPADGGIFIHKMSPCSKTSAVLNITSCKRYTLNNITYDSSGSYTQSLMSSAGCDSIVTLNLTIQTLVTNVSAVACDSYVWQDSTLTKSGTYNAFLTSVGGCDSILRLHLTINEKTVFFVNADICKGQSYLGHTTSGVYVDTFHVANRCDSLVNVHLTVLEKPAPDLGTNTALCPGDSLKLSPGVFQTYLWQDNSFKPDFVVKKAGLYTVTVSNSCGTGYGEIQITEKNCKTYFPTAFTPNNDGRNDRFMILNPSRLSDFRLSVYNKLGEKVFETTDYLQGWNGNYKNQLAGQGVYVWFCSFTEFSVAKKIKGTVVLLR